MPTVNDQHAAFFKDGEIVELWALMFRLYIRDFHGRASNLDDAEKKALAAASHAIDNREELLGNGRDFRVVSFAAVDNDFLYPPMSAAPSIIAPKVSDLRWDQDARRWVVTLQARWREQITLDADYNLLSMKRME